MSYCAEIVTYRITVDENEFVALRRAAIADVKSHHPALMHVPFVGKRDDGTYIDAWVYSSRAAAEAANSSYEGMPNFQKFLQVLADIQIEYTDFPASAVNPLS